MPKMAATTPMTPVAPEMYIGLAAPLLVAELLLVLVPPLLPLRPLGLFALLLQVNVPPMVFARPPERGRKWEQVESMFWVDWRLKAPLTLFNCGRVRLESVSVRFDYGHCPGSPLKGTCHVNGTANVCETWETVDLLQGGVVGHNQTPVNLPEGRCGDVGKLVVADEGQTASDNGEVGHDHGLHHAAFDAERSVDCRQRRDVDGGAVGQAHVGGPCEVGEGGLHSISVLRERQGVANVAELHADVVEEKVVDHEECVDFH